MENVERRIYRHYRSENWCPYQGVIHKADDTRVRAYDESVCLSAALAVGIEDGDEIEIVVRKTGRKLTTRWELVADHEYAQVDAPKSAGCPKCQKMAAQAGEGAK